MSHTIFSQYYNSTIQQHHHYYHLGMPSPLGSLSLLFNILSFFGRPHVFPKACKCRPSVYTASVTGCFAAITVNTFLYIATYNNLLLLVFVVVAYYTLMSSLLLLLLLLLSRCVVVVDSDGSSVDGNNIIIVLLTHN
eukprot:GHVS01066657.1.p1 GENE.GHVS01066657.1~~GHVS01066657.1.p1  ORF type:complete len:137 (-),score=22.88 GHVS01066657.1:433-843(-)